MTMSRLLCVLTILIWFSYAEELYDLRIHEGAEKGSRLTMGVAFQRKMETMKNCYGQLDSDIHWIDYKSSRNAFYTNTAVPDARNGPDLIGSLHLLCAGNRIQTLDFKVHISHRNHHPPTFGRESYNIYAPISLGRDAVVAKLDVVDNDPVIYNSERQLSFTEDQSLFGILSDGTIQLKKPLGPEVPYKPIHMQVLAIDYGSPQLYSIANVTITPVTVSEVRDLRVNIATKDYQIFEWDLPAYGRASRFRLSVRKGTQVLYEEEIDGKHVKALTKVPVTPAGNFSYRVIAQDVQGSTPSEWKTFNLFHTKLECKGECAKGGIPLCYYGAFNRPEQYSDEQGAHCMCFPGFKGVGCDTIATCAMEKTVDAYGGLDWNEVASNQTVRVPCPYNNEQDNQWLERSCIYDRLLDRAIWGRPREQEKCKLQSSVLTHLGMLGTFAGNANSVSTIHTVARFIRDLLAVPAFSNHPNSTAHFDQKIAENVARVVESILAMDLDSLQGNTSLAKGDLWSAVRELGRRLPNPFMVSSPEHNLYMKSMNWHRHSDPMDTPIGTRCRINLPKVNPNQVLRGICMSNSTFFEIVDQAMPVLSLEVDNNSPFSFTRFTIMLKPKDLVENYTCVYYDEQEGGWSTKGIRRMDANFHGFVRCETNHLGVFSLLPDRLFHSDEESLRELARMGPTATTVIAVLVSIFVLFLAAFQRNQTIDFAYLVFLFFVFVMHVAHFIMLLGPQIGEPFSIAPIPDLVIQFCVLSTSAMICLVLYSLRKIIVWKEQHKENEEDIHCCSQRCSVLTLGFLIPGFLTFTTYYLADDYEHDFSRALDRIDWLFLMNYLGPAAFFYSLAIVIALWNFYQGNLNRSKHRGTSDRYLALSPAINASISSIFMILLLIGFIVLFHFREQSVKLALLFCGTQLSFYIPAVIFAACLFRARYHSERDSIGSCQSLERKRDISRALLEHVDSAKQTENGGSRSPSEVYLHLSQHIYERTPMVSIV